MTAMHEISLSIILPVHNMAKYLPFTLVNLSQQQFSADNVNEWELIIVDDGSTDSSREIIETFVKSHTGNIHYLPLDKNYGVSTARNKGFQAAKGRFVYFADGDDILKQNALKMLTDIALHNDCDVLHHGYEEVSPQRYEILTTDVPTVINPKPDVVTESGKNFLERTRGLLYPMVSLSVWQNLFRREFLLKSRISFAGNLTIGEDSIFVWTVMLSNPRVATIGESMYYYQIHPNSAIHSSDLNNRQAMIGNRFRYIDSLFAIQNKVKEGNYGSPVSYGLATEIKNVYYVALADMILTKAGAISIIKQLKKYRRAGGDIRIGRPKFNHLPGAEFSVKMHVKRWLIAYPLAIMVRYGII